MPHAHLLTGASGFLGAYLQATLKSEGVLFDCVVRTGARNNDILADLEHDIPVFKRPYERIIHAANLAHQSGDCNVGAAKFHSVNVTGTMNLLDGLERSGCIPAQFVYISSVSVYGQDKGIDISEQTIVKPMSPYATSKLECERLLNIWCRDFGVDLLILRTPLIIGLNPKGNLRRMCRAISRGYYFSIRDNLARKSVVHARSLSELIVKYSSELDGVYNASDSSDPLFTDIEQCFATLLGKKIRIRFSSSTLHKLTHLNQLMSKFGLPAVITPHTVDKILCSLTFDSSKIREVCDWTPVPALEMLEREI